MMSDAQTRRPDLRAQMACGKTRILMLGNFLSGHGGNRSVSEDLADRLENRSYAVLRSSARRSRLGRFLARLATVVARRGQYDVAHVDVFSGSAFCWAEASCLALRAMRRPFCLTLHGGGLPDFSRRHPTRVKRVLESAYAVTVPSRYLLEQMRPYCRRLMLLPNPLDTASYAFHRRDRLQPNLAWLRAFHRTYNPSLAVRTAALLKARGAPVRVTMYGPDTGDGSLDQCRRLVQDLDAADQVEFAGSIARTDVASRLNQSDIFINTTNVDNTPVSVIEAMACGLCVVSTSVGGIPYLLTHEQDALLVPPDDPASMAAAIQRLLSEPSLAATLSENAREGTRTLDWSVILPAWEHILTGTMKGMQDG